MKFGQGKRSKRRSWWVKVYLQHTPEVVFAPGDGYLVGLGLANVAERRTSLGLNSTKVPCHRALSAKFSLNLREVSVKQGGQSRTARRF